jgi:hypothetical protein
MMTKHVARHTSIHVCIHPSIHSFFHPSIHPLRAIAELSAVWDAVHNQVSEICTDEEWSSIERMLKVGDDNHGVVVGGGGGSGSGGVEGSF